MEKKFIGEKFIGILTLDTSFPRIVGDVGNPDSYECPVRISVVAGVGVQKLVHDQQIHPTVIRQFQAQARELEQQGAVAIISSCGFLHRAQSQIASAVRVPVLLSPLGMLPSVRMMTNAKPIIVVTAKKAAIEAQIGAHEADGLHITGLDDVPAFRDTILAKATDKMARFDRDAIEQAIIQKCKIEMANTPRAASILLECGNLNPYRERLKAITGLPVFGIVSMAEWLWHSSASKQGTA